MSTTDLPFDAVLFDIGGTLVEAAPPGTAVRDLDVRVRDGADRTIAALAAAGLRIGAVTDTTVMTEADVRETLAGSPLDGAVTEVVTSVDVGAAKPSPDGIREAMRRLGLTDPARVLFVGDADADRGAASAAGTAFAAVRDDEPLHLTLLRALVDAGGRPVEAARVVVAPPDLRSAAEADARQGQLTKPPGALGRLETLGTQLAAIAGQVPPPIPEPAAVAVFAGDHGVLAEGVSPWPQEVTAQMVANFATGGAAVNVLAREVGASVTVVDVGVATPYRPADGIVDRNVRRGTRNLAAGPALTDTEVAAALDAGAAVALDLVAGGARCLVTGDMGIGNTTPSAALVAAFTGRSAAAVTGRGTGVADDVLATKVRVVDAALGRLARGAEPRRVLAEVGGLEHVALAGFIIGAAAARVPVIVDGVISAAALLAAHALVPGVLPYVVAGHRSTEPGSTAVLAHLGLEPLLDLGLRLGEGTGAVLALPLVRAAARILGEMATFDQAGVATKDA
jgi:nicotinate-nucleotide--dimethylbenzimidazole phosphoribosyltransferase